MIVKAKRFFQQLNWLVFLAYLLFGLGGGIASACCSGGEAAACAGTHDPCSAEGCQTSAGITPAPCHSCSGHHQTAAAIGAHLVSFQPSPRSLDPVTIAGLTLETFTAPVMGVTGFTLRPSGLQQNPALIILRSTVLLL